MRVNESDWDDIRERLKAANSLKRFEDYKDNPMVQGLIRFININANAPLTDVTSWYIEATESDEKAFIVTLKDGRKYIGTLVPSYAIEGRWGCHEFKPEHPLEFTSISWDVDAPAGTSFSVDIVVSPKSSNGVAR